MSTTRTTSSGVPVKPVYGPSDLPAHAQPERSAGPGVPPFVRGAYEQGYGQQPWRIFQLSGHGNPEDEAERIRFLLDRGSTGFIMEHDRNTADHLYDVDHPEVVARREDVGLTGAVILSVRDYEIVLDGIAIERTYAHPGGGVVQHGPFALACYWTIAHRRGIPLRQLRGTGQSDFFLTYLGCIPKQQIPARDGLRLNADIIEFCTKHLPHWVPVSIAGYNGADSGLNGWQELGAVLANAVEQLDVVVARNGRQDLEAFARGLGGVNFRTSLDLFEDVAKLRAARLMWHELLSSRYGVTDPRALRLRIHALTAGSAMTYQQPLNNLVRGTIMGLAGVLAGVQSLGISGYDEALSVPSEHAHQMSVRIQQILQHETNLASVTDPLGGSYYVESLTAELADRGWEFFRQIEQRGGFVEALDTGWLHQQAAHNQLADIRGVTDGSRTVVGVNAFQDDLEPWPIDGFKGSSDAWERGTDRLEELRRTRDGSRVVTALRELLSSCGRDRNIMPAMLEAVDADASLGEIGDVFREAFGDWRIPVAF